jgi:hypothetical protein
MKDTQRIKNMNDLELRDQVAEIVRVNQRNEDLLETVERFLPWAKGIFVTAVSGAVMIAIWVTTIEYRQQDFSEGHKDHHEQLKQINAWQIKTEANRFTSKDASEMMNNLMSAAATQDKRLQRVEDSNVVIKEALHRIETKLQ